MKQDLRQLRRSIEARIKAGDVPDWSWRHHVQLIEAIDAVLHDLALMPGHATPRLSDRIHLLPRTPGESSASRARRAH